MDDLKITNEDLQLAAQQEENNRLTGQIRQLSDRVVILRALTNRQAQRIEELEKLVSPIETEESEKEDQPNGRDVK